MTALRPAFTLLELLLATALAALLMVLILTISSRLRSTRALLAVPDTSHPESEQVVRLLERDLVMAEQVRVEENAVTIEGYSRLDPLTQDLRQGPTRVGYRLISAGGHGYLVRQQSMLESRNNQESQVELLGCRVRGFALEALSSTSSTATTRPTPAKQACYGLTVTWEKPAAAPLHKLLLVE